jgi:hypothetical protein
MIRNLTQALCWATVPLLAACTAHQHQPFDGDPRAGYFAMPVASRESIFDYYAPPPQVETFEMPVRKVPGYDVSGIRFPSSAYNGQPGNQVEARYFQSQRRTEGPKPLLIVMPIWDTHTFPSTIVAHGYPVHSQGAVNILWMQGDGHLFDWFHLADIEAEDEFVDEIDRSVERFRTVTVDTRRLLDWAETRPEIDAGRIGIIGFSMSALVAANVAGTDRRIHTGVYMVGGARPWDVMSYCSVVVGYMRDNVKENLGWSQEQFRSFFHAKLAEGDPALWRGRFRAENSLIIDSAKDDCMPPESREALWQAMGQPERIMFPYNHWQPFLALTPVGNKVLTRDIYAFLDRKLLAPPTRREASAGDYIPTVASEAH